MAITRAQPHEWSHFGPAMVRFWKPTGRTGTVDVVRLPGALGVLRARWRELKGERAVGRVASFELDGRALSLIERFLDTSVGNSGTTTDHYEESGLVEGCVDELLQAVEAGGVVQSTREADGSWRFKVSKSESGAVYNTVVYVSGGVEGVLDATATLLRLERSSYVDTSS